MLSDAQEKWRARSGPRALAIGAAAKPPPAGIYRIEFDTPGGEAWLTTPDYRRVARFKADVPGARRGLFSARIKQGECSAQIERFGPGVVKWPT